MNVLLITIQSKMGELDPANNLKDYRKLVRFMTGRGYIEKAIEEVFSKK